MTRSLKSGAREHRLTPVAALLASGAFALMLAPSAHAQAAAQPAAPAKDESADAAKKSDVVGLDRIVVTATSALKSKLRTSVSVTALPNPFASSLPMALLAPNFFSAWASASTSLMAALVAGPPSPEKPREPFPAMVMTAPEAAGV